MTNLTLYTYFRSSCSTRIRTAASIKGIDLKYKYVNLIKGEQALDSYTAEINPSAFVPTLEISNANGSKSYIRQSLAILEYFEEAFPDRKPLLPPSNQLLQRALVRDLVGMLGVDVQPRTNLRVLKYVNDKGIESKVWCQAHMPPGFQAFEAVVKSSAGRFSVGDSLTLADVILLPAVEGALRWQVDLTPFPTLMRVYNELKILPEVVQADWKHQEDTPEELRERLC